MIDDDLSWMDEKVDGIKGHNFFYKILCFFLFRMRKKIRYKDLFLLYYGLHRNKIGEQNAKKKALKSVIKIYNENNSAKISEVNE